MKKVIIIGGTSGIGEELAKRFDSNGFSVGITGRREMLLKEVQRSLKNESFYKVMDVVNDSESIVLLNEMIKEMGSVDIVILNAGIGVDNKDLEWSIEKQMISTNAVGFAALATESFNYFVKQGFGQIVGVSSISCLRGSQDAPSYSASKAFVSNFLEGLLIRSLKMKMNIDITDIRPGFIDTAMTKGQQGMFWVCSVQKASDLIYKAIIKKKRISYVPGKWSLLAWFIKRLPVKTMSKF